jgi:hypothetical protein
MKRRITRRTTICRSFWMVRPNTPARKLIICDGRSTRRWTRSQAFCSRASGPRRSRLTPSLTRQPKTHMRGARSLLCVSAGFQFPIFRTRLLGSDESKSGSRTSPLVPEPRRATCQGIADGKPIASDEHWERVAAPRFGRVLHRNDRFPHASNGDCSSCGAEVRGPVCPEPCRGEGQHPAMLRMG